MVPIYGRSPRSRIQRRAFRRIRPAPLSSVWPCAQGDLCEGTGLLASWLMYAVIKVVTTYTRPGQRVLLLEPPLASGPSPAAGRFQTQHGPYAGLHEAAWTVVRVGRGVQTQLIGVVDHRDETQSAIGLHSRTESVDPAPADRYDLVLAAIDPETLHWFRPVEWVHLLNRAGVVCVVTRATRSGGRFTDPAGQLVRAAHDAGLRYVDRIALLRVPVHEVLCTGGTAPGAGEAQARPVRPARHSQVHDDLLVFGLPSRSVSVGESGGNRR